MNANSHSTSPPAGYAERVQLAVRTTAIWIILLALVVLAREFFLLMFAAVLFAVFVSEGARLIQKWTGLQQKVALTVWLLALLTLVCIGLWIGGQMLLEQSREAISAIRKNLDQMDQQIDKSGFPWKLQDMAPSSASGQSFGFARAFFSSTFGFFTNTLFIIVVGVFLASSPQSYRNGIARLFPSQWRDGILRMMELSGKTLKHWLLGQLFAMSIIGVAVGVSLTILGVPAAAALGLFAGAISFIPTIGATLAIIPALILAAQQGSTTVLAVLVIYGITQFFESNVATPLIQNQQVDLTAATILGGQMFAGLLFGFLGVALITPFLALVQLWIRKLYLPARDRNTSVRKFVSEALRNPDEHLA